MLFLPVTHSSQVAEVRRAVAKMAKERGFEENDIGRASIVTTELSTNLIKHGGGGDLLLSDYKDETGSGIEVLSVDRGPGMVDVSLCIRDGYSTAGSAGQGLGAVIRQSQAFDIYSRPGLGTIVLARLSSGRSAPPDEPFARWGAVNLPKNGEPVCGDSWHVAALPLADLVVVADGLGHGSLAADASLSAVRLFQKYATMPVQMILERIHTGLRATRGAAVAVARIDYSTRQVEFAGIGNISGSLVTTHGTKKMISINGTAGHIARKIQVFNYPFDAPPMTILHSDGVATSWNLERYPGLLQRHPSLISAMLYRDFHRARDDATVVAISGRPA
jgi:anti-sigma regulatory factor (Ser/Thr protein kinase)